MYFETHDLSVGYGGRPLIEKINLSIEKGRILTLIGPNGSGKSNIADAIRWVLGEQNARALRGARMEDVIFSGTQQRRAQAYCEVTLTFDNADGLLHVPFSEVAVTRRVYRSGESEYCINRSPCRLRDIVEMFRDTGVGRDGYSIIGQGRVDEILANKSNERRAALEEAAGIMRYRVRKEEAERKLEHAGKNLERLEDILSELHGRLEPLEKQSAEARAYLKLRDELRDLEINLFLYRHARGQERLAALEETLGQLSGEQAQGEEQAAAAQLLVERGADLLLRRPALRAQDHVPRRGIQHPRRHDRMAEVPLALSLEREQIQQHLHAETVAQIRQVEGFFARLIVHHADIELSVPEPAVHAVDLAGDGEGALPLADRDGRELPVPSAEAQLELQRHEVGL